MDEDLEKLSEELDEYGTELANLIEETGLDIKLEANE